MDADRRDPPGPRLPGSVCYPAYALFLAIVLTLCDGLAHVRQDVLFYTDPGRFSLLAGQPTAEVFAGFVGVAAFCTGAGWALFRHADPPGVPRAATATAIFVGCYFASGLLRDAPMVLYAAFMAIWLAQLLTYPSTDVRRVVALSVLFGVLGPIVEGWRSSTGSSRTTTRTRTTSRCG